MVHYENLKEDLVSEMEVLMDFLNLPLQTTDTVLDNKLSRIECLVKYKDGFFKRDSEVTRRKSKKDYNVQTPFSKDVRKQMDNLIDHINQNVLKRNGYSEMPLHLYNYYRKVRVTNKIKTGKKNS